MVIAGKASDQAVGMFIAAIDRWHRDVMVENKGNLHLIVAAIFVGLGLVACGGGGGNDSSSERRASKVQNADGGPESGNDQAETVPGATDIDDDGAGAQVSGDGAVNSAPSISGNPPTSIVQNSTFEFTPRAIDPDADPLVFTVTNKPDWASFDPATGTLGGTPTAADIGVIRGIVIRVSDSRTITALPPFDIVVNAFGSASVTLSWLSPRTREDGRPLMNLAGFRIYYGTQSNVYSEVITIDNPGVSSFVIDNLSADRTYFFAATAFDESGNESRFSNEVSKSL